MVSVSVSSQETHKTENSLPRLLSNRDLLYFAQFNVHRAFYRPRLPGHCDVRNGSMGICTVAVSFDLFELKQSMFCYITMEEKGLHVLGRP